MGTDNQTIRSDANKRKPAWLYILCLCIVIFLVAPSIIVIPMSFSESKFLTFPPEAWSIHWYKGYFTSIEWRDATLISFKAAIGTTILATPLGAMAAYGLTVSKAPYARFVRVLFLLPMAMPIILISVSTFLLYARLGLNNTITGLILAHTCLAIPLVFITVGSSLKHFDFDQELGARSLGASRLKAFMTITLPQIRLAVLSGAVLSFITSLDEVVVALFISGGENATLTRRMFTSLRDEVDPTIAAISSLLIIISITLLGGIRLLRKDRG